MPAPYDYSLNVQSPFEAALGGLKLGATFADIQQQQEMSRIKQLEMQKAAEQQQMIQDARSRLLGNPNPTARDYVNFAMLLPEKEAASVRSNFDVLNKSQQDNELRFGGQIMSAFESGAPQLGVQMLRQRAEAEANAGRADQAKAFETYAKLAEVNPKAAQKTIGIMLAAIPGGKEVLDSAIKSIQAPEQTMGLKLGNIEKQLTVENLPAKQELERVNTQAQIKNIESQIAERSGRLNLDKDKLQSDVEMKLYELGRKGGQLESDARKIVNDSTIASVGAEQNAARMLDLATRIEGAEGGKGQFTKASEWFAKSTGRQDEWSNLRQEYVRVKNTQAIKSLPPGPATDKDIEIAMKGFPDENADAKTIGSFLRGMAKLQQVEASAKSAEAEWVNATGSLGRSKQDIEIDGIQVPAGTTFVDFMRQFGEKRAQGLADQQAAPQTNRRSYQRWANQ